jgi:5-formyltetrahydrofolate cyclo-ligase
MSASGPRELKRRLRDVLRARLSTFGAEDARRAGKAIAERLVEWPRWQGASSVALYRTLPGEVDTQPAIDAVRSANKTLLLPRLVGPRLEFARVDETDALIRGRFGLLEPDVTCPAEEPGPDTLVLVPGLAFDRSGGRLGRGAGYYDRALAPVAARPERALLIGVAFAAQIVASVPVEAHDVRMDGWVTDEELMLRG